MPETTKRARKTASAVGGAAFAKERDLKGVMIYLSEEDRRRLKSAAALDGVSISDFLRPIIAAKIGK